MRFVDEFRNPMLAKTLIERLHQQAALLPHTIEKSMQIMEVCGDHTHAIFRFGLDKLLPPQLESIHWLAWLSGVRVTDGTHRCLL